MAHILVTNDDGFDSPFLPPLIEALAPHARLTVVVPKIQQSWKGKSLTRYTAITHEESRLAGHPVHLLDGTPGDCANIGIHHLAGEVPDLVVSGINLGLNVGSAFVPSSGTIGAGFEANLSGVPAIALSQELNSDCWAEYHRSGQLPAAELARFRTAHQYLVPHLLSLLSAPPALLSTRLTWNINFPVQVQADTAMVLVPVGRTSYGSCFASTAGGFVHSFKGLELHDGPDTDLAQLRRGNITVSPLSLEVPGASVEHVQAEWNRRTEVTAR